MQLKLNIVPLLLLCIYIKPFLQRDQGDLETPN